MLLDYFIKDHILKGIVPQHLHDPDSECLLKFCALYASFASA